MEIGSSINSNILSSNHRQTRQALREANKTLLMYYDNTQFSQNREDEYKSYIVKGMSNSYNGLSSLDREKSIVELNGNEYITYFKTDGHYVVDENTDKNLTSKLDPITLSYVLFKAGNLSSDTQSIDEKQILNLMLDDMVIEQTDNIFGRLGRHNYSIYSFSQNLYVNYSYADKFNSSHKSNDNYWSNYYFNDFSYYRHNYDAPDAILKE
ncbi:hypothetical protein CFT12S00416_08195, partial [Campylobacter fetus subsp. testudinum]|uniref:hypothetical protein n=1 Tax=Campylobacter fetus TaxID=196 RepID=UPI00081DFDDF